MALSRRDRKSRSGLPHFMWSLWVVATVVWGTMLATIGYWEWLDTTERLMGEGMLVEHDVRDTANVNTGSPGNVLPISELGTVIIVADQPSVEEAGRIKNLKEQRMRRVAHLRRKELIYISTIHFGAFAIPSFVLFAVGRLSMRLLKSRDSMQINNK